MFISPLLSSVCLVSVKVNSNQKHVMHFVTLLAQSVYLCPKEIYEFCILELGLNKEQKINGYDLI